METLALARRAEIDAMRATYGHVCSSHAFPSLYLWRGALGLEYWVKDQAYAVRRADDDSWFFPCGSEAGSRAFLTAHEGQPLALRYLRAQDKAWLDAAQPGRWQFIRTPNDDEYLYDRAEHLAVQGHAYAHMRQRFHKLERCFAVRIAPVNEPDASDALAQREELQMQGLLVYLNDAPAALVLGYLLSPDIFDVVVGKCAEPVQGLIYYALHALCAALPAGVKTLNLEEDLGLAGLREMKKHYQPNGKNEFWEARRK